MRALQPLPAVVLMADRDPLGTVLLVVGSLSGAVIVIALVVGAVRSRRVS